MSGTYSASQLGVSFWISPGDGRDLGAERHAEPVQLVERLLAHHHHDPRLHDGQLVEHAGAALRRREVGVGHRALHEHRAVDGERVDARGA